MYVDKVHLKNIRGFENLEFSLRRADGRYAGWTVFTGDNGSGKSTLLKAIALGIMHGRDESRAATALLPNFNGWIREQTLDNHAAVSLSVFTQKSDDTLSFANPEDEDFAEWLKSGHFSFKTSFFLKKVEKRVIQYETLLSGAAMTDNEDVVVQNGWFSCGYGPFRRVAGASAEATQIMSNPVTGRYATLFQEAASLFEVDQWLRKLNYKALEGKLDEKAQLELVLEILRDDLMPNQITVDRVDSDGLWLKDRNGLQLAWRDMSDGYRSAVALLADILRHMINCYGTEGLSARDANGKLFITRSGVVLIDEIDAHLHPEWQQKIGFWLTSHFPHIQFLVTTHSPIICQAADDNGLFVLPEPGSADTARALTHSEYEAIIAARPDTILLSPAFGLQNTRSARAVEGRAAYAKLKAKKRAGARLTEVEIGQLAELEKFANTKEEV